MSTARKPVLLIIRDGWGRNPHPEQASTNAVALAKKPTDDALQASAPVAYVSASGLDVGLPDGQMGNSEVGHENIGAGRIVDQELVRLNKLFSEKQLAQNATWHGVLVRLRTKPAARLHLMGIVSDGGVHGMLEHLYGLLAQAQADGIAGDRVFVHGFTDGRDTAPSSALGFIRQVEAKIVELGHYGRIATITGRFWAMDRDNRWERVQKAYDLLTGRAVAATAPSAEAAIQHYYDHPLSETQKGDEFVAATAILNPATGQPLAHFADGDAVVFYNYRGDRPREITRAFVMDDFTGFERGPKLDLYYATMTEYEAGLPVHIISPKPPKLKNILGEVVAAAGIAQFRCAETEKNPHVTFFFNNYRKEPFPLEDRACPASPKVATYDLQPEMNAAEVTRLSKEAILSGKYGLVIVNYANPDMVGHTGSIPATTQACEATDAGVGELLAALKTVDGRAVVCADHGNAEQMWDPVLPGPHTAHTLNLVEVFVVGEGFSKATVMRTGGRLADIAPTLLHLMGLAKPVEMTGHSLIVD
jgi:2,3-bisphosphoglycerate-independent phosphoglycerate mutase